MPQFHRMMGERLRCVEQGADTVVWLALSKAAIKTPRGQFFQGQWVPFFDRVGQNPDPGRKKAFTKAGRWPGESFIRLVRNPVGFYFSRPGFKHLWLHFALQSEGPSPPTCLWPGLAALQKTFRLSSLSWMLRPQASGHSKTRRPMPTGSLLHLRLPQMGCPALRLTHQSKTCFRICQHIGHV